MEVKRYTPELAETWDAFVAQSRNGTLFHTRRFLSYHPEDRFEDHSLLFYDENRLLAVLPAAVREEDGKKSLIAHPGGTFGGLVLSPKIGATATCAIVEALVSSTKNERFASLSLLRLTPFLLCRAPSEDLPYALLQCGFHIERCELGCAVLLHSLTRETLLTHFDTQCRNEVRQAERAGVIVRCSDDYEAFWPILEKNLHERHAVKPTHTLAEIRRLLRLFPAVLRLFGAYDGKTLIAGVVIVDIAEHAVYCKYIGQDFAHQRKRPLNLLITAVLRDSLERHRNVVDLGVSMAESRTGLHDGIFAFKEGFGARSVRRESYSLDL